MRSGVRAEEALHIKTALAKGADPEELAQQYRVPLDCILSFEEPKPAKTEAKVEDKKAK